MRLNRHLQHVDKEINHFGNKDDNNKKRVKFVQINSKTQTLHNIATLIKIFKKNKNYNKKKLLR